MAPPATRYALVPAVQRSAQSGASFPFEVTRYKSTSAVGAVHPGPRALASPTAHRGRIIQAMEQDAKYVWISDDEEAEEGPSEMDLTPQYDDQSGAYHTDYQEVVRIQQEIGKKEELYCRNRAAQLWKAASGWSDVTVAVACVLDVRLGSPETTFEKSYLVALNGQYGLQQAVPMRVKEQLGENENMVPGVMASIDKATSHAERNIIAYINHHQNLVALAAGADKGVCWVEDGNGGCAVKLDGVNQRQYWPVGPKPLYTKRKKEGASKVEKKQIASLQNQGKLDSWFTKKN